MRRLLITLLAFALCLDAAADVYLLGPGGGSTGARSSAELTSILGTRKIFEEPVVVNGLSLRLSVSLVNDTLSGCLAILRRNFPNAFFQVNNDGIQVREKKGKGSVRLLLVKMGEQYPAIQFSLEVPGKIPTKFDWPKELPLIPGAEPLMYMFFPERGTLYGCFSSELEPSVALGKFSSSAQSEGWSAASPGAMAVEKNGGVWVRSVSPQAMLTVNFIPGRGMVYFRPLK